MIVRTVVPLIVFESVRIRELEQGIPSLQSGVGTDQGGALRPEAVRFGVVELGDGKRFPVQAADRDTSG